MSSVRDTFFVAELFENRRHDVIYDALTISLRCPTMSYDALRVEPAREKQVERKKHRGAKRVEPAREKKVRGAKRVESAREKKVRIRVRNKSGVWDGWVKTSRS